MKRLKGSINATRSRAARAQTEIFSSRVFTYPACPRGTAPVRCTSLSSSPPACSDACRRPNSEAKRSHQSHAQQPGTHGRASTHQPSSATGHTELKYSPNALQTSPQGQYLAAATLWYILRPLRPNCQTATFCFLNSFCVWSKGSSP